MKKWQTINLYIGNSTRHTLLILLHPLDKCWCSVVSNQWQLDKKGGLLTLVTNHELEWSEIFMNLFAQVFQTKIYGSCLLSHISPDSFVVWWEDILLFWQTVCTSSVHSLCSVFQYFVGWILPVLLASLCEAILLLSSNPPLLSFSSYSYFFLPRGCITHRFSYRLCVSFCNNLYFSDTNICNFKNSIWMFYPEETISPSIVYNPVLWMN